MKIFPHCYLYLMVIPYGIYSFLSNWIFKLFIFAHTVTTTCNINVGDFLCICVTSKVEIEITSFIMNHIANVIFTILLVFVLVVVVCEKSLFHTREFYSTNKKWNQEESKNLDLGGNRRSHWRCAIWYSNYYFSKV